jgi:AraC-like DNA-binding protein
MAVLMRIYAADDHIMVLTDAVDASFHRHLYVQLSIALDKEFYMEVDGARFLCPGIVLDSQLEHGMDSNRGRQLFLLADRASGLAASLRAAFLEKAGGRYALLPQEAGSRIGELLDREPELWEQAGNYPLLLSRVLELLGIEDRAAVNRRITDGRVQQTVEALRSGHLTGLTITELARRTLLSPNRLSHLFKAETGMPLGSYGPAQAGERHAASAAAWQCHRSRHGGGLRQPLAFCGSQQKNPGHECHLHPAG